MGEALINKKLLDAAIRNSVRSWQKVLKTKARFRLLISRFVRAKNRCKGDLARCRMYEFLDRLLNVAFLGLRTSWMNPTLRWHGIILGLTEQIIFPRSTTTDREDQRSQVAIVTTAPTDQEAAACSSAGYAFKR